jgi:hypothetical protein
VQGIEFGLMQAVSQPLRPMGGRVAGAVGDEEVTNVPTVTSTLSRTSSRWAGTISQLWS